MNWLANHAVALGLVLNLVGAIIVAAAQNLVSKNVNAWLKALDFTIEQWFSGTREIALFTGFDTMMGKTMRRSSRWAVFGWVLIVVGVLFQIAATFFDPAQGK